MKIHQLFLAFILGITSLNSIADTSSQYNKIERIKINGIDGYYYFLSESGQWGAPGCESATYAYVKPSVIVSKEILTVALSAKLAKQEVLFTGTCDSGGEYLQAHSIWVR